MAEIEKTRSVFADLIVWLFIIGALLLRIVYNLALHPNGHPPIDFVIDEREYFGAAHVLAEGRGFSFFDTALWMRPPLYVLLLAPFLLVSDVYTTLIMLAQSFLSAATLLPLAWLAFRVGGLATARWAVLFGALYLPFTLFAGLLLSETLFLFLFSLTLVALLRSQETLSEGVPLWQRWWLSLLWAGASGLLLGLCALTRATALGFVPLAALWLFFSTRKAAFLRTRVLASGVLVIVCALALLPWIARNYSAYSQFVLVDTTSGYNLWLGSVGVRDEAHLQSDLRTLHDPVERQNFAYEYAWENIRHDPAGFIGKGLKESLDLWQPLFGAEERQIAGYTLGRVPGWHLYALLLFDDILYLLILLFSILGLFLSSPHPFKSLTLLWVLLWVVMSFVFFAVTRFRLPVVVVLIPWAGLGIAALRPLKELPAKLSALSRLKQVTGIALALGAFVLVVPPIVESVGHVGLGAERWAQQEPYREAEAALPVYPSVIKDIDSIIALYRHANLDIADTRYGLASTLLMKGDVSGALAQLQPDEPPDRFEPFILRGEAARQSGDLEAARSLFNARPVNQAGEKAIEWAWNHLYPPPVDHIQIGSGLDLGYIRGFYGPEMDKEGRPYRWTGKSAEIRNVTLGDALEGRTVSWSGWRPTSARAEVSEYFSSSPMTLPNDENWHTQTLPLRGRYDEIFDINPFVASGSDPRLLGIRISRAYSTDD